MRGAGETQLVTVPLNTGVNQSVAERMAPIGSLRECTNMRLRDGQLVKRGGFTKSAGDSNTGAGSVLLAASLSSAIYPLPSFISHVGDCSIIGNTEGNCFSYNPALDFYSTQGRFSTCKPIRERNGFSLLTPDAGATTQALGEGPPSIAVDQNGYVCCAVTDSGGTAYYVWIESPQGARIYYAQVSGGTWNRVQVVATSETFILIVQSGVSISAQTITVADTVTPGVLTLVATLHDAAQHWDTSARGVAGSWTAAQKRCWYIAYNVTRNVVRVLEYSGVTATGQIFNMNLTPSPIVGQLSPCSVWADNTGGTLYVWVGAYNSATDIGLVQFAVGDFATVAPTIIVFCATILDTGSSSEYGPPMFGAWREANSLATPTHDTFIVVRRSNGTTRWAYTGNADADGTSSLGSPDPGFLPLGKPDNAHRVWCLVGNGSANQLEQRVALMEWNLHSDGVVLASSSQLTMPAALSPADNATHKHHWLTGASCAYSSSLPGVAGSYFFAFPLVLSQLEDSTLVSIAVYEYASLLESRPQQCLPCGVSACVTGQPTEFFARPAGNAVGTVYEASAECGWLYSPTIISIATTAAAGPGAGTYAYRAVYEWVDVYGRRHRSAPSAPVSVTLTTGNQRPQLTVSALTLSRRCGARVLSPQVVLYRTQNGGTQYQRAQIADPLDDTGVVLITDDSTDAEIDANEFIYTDGGVLDFGLGPSCSYLARSEDRVWCGGLWRRDVIQCSRVIVPGEPIQFADDASHQVLLTDDNTGLAYMDGTVVAFTRDSIQLIAGDGPNEQGIGSFPPPRIHTSGIGCDNALSIVQTPAGIFFMSRRGLYLLPRGFGPVQYVSGPVRSTLQTYPYCVAAAFMDSGPIVNTYGTDTGPGRQSIVQWLLGLASTEPGNVALSLDLITNQWFVDEYAVSASDNFYALGVWRLPTTLAADGGLLGTEPTLARASQLITTTSPIAFDTDAFTDGALPTGYITQELKTNWLSPFGVGGWGSVRRAMVVFERDPSSDASSPVDVTLTIQTDANTAQSKTWRIEQGTGGSGAGVEYREMALQVPHCTSLQATFSDAFVSPDTHARGVKPMALVLEVETTGSLRLTTEQERG